MTGRDAEPPVQEVSPKSHPPGRPRAPSYRVMLDVPKDLIWFVSGLLAARRRSIGTRKKTRKLGCYRQAVFGLAWFRDKGSIPRLGAGFGLSQATAYRYLDEVIDVPAEQAPGLREALERALAEGTPYVVLDGKVVDSDRCHEKTTSRKGTEIDLWYSGKRKDFGGNIQAVFYPDGRPMWVSDVLPGSVTVPGRGPRKRPGDAAGVRGGDAGPGRRRVRRRRSRRPHPVKKPAGMKELDINARTRNALIRSVRCLENAASRS